MQQKVRVYSTYLVFGLIEQVALWKVGKLVQDLNELIKDLFFFKTQAMRTLGKTLSFHGVMIKSHAPVLRYIATHIIPLDMSSCIFLTVYQQGSNSSICRLMSYWWCQGVNSFIVFHSAQLHQLPDWARTSPGAVSYQKAMGIYWNTCPGPSEHSESETMGNNSSAPLKVRDSSRRHALNLKVLNQLWSSDVCLCFRHIAGGMHRFMQHKPITGLTWQRLCAATQVLWPFLWPSAELEDIRPHHILVHLTTMQAQRWGNVVTACSRVMSMSCWWRQPFDVFSQHWWQDPNETLK